MKQTFKSIIAMTIIAVISATILLVGHFHLEWFSDSSENTTPDNEYHCSYEPCDNDNYNPSDPDLDALQNLVQLYRSQVGSLETKISQLQDLNQNMTAQVTQLEGIIYTLTQVIDNNGDHAEVIYDLTKQIQTLNSTIISNTGTIKDLQTQVTDMQEVIDDMQEKVEVLGDLANLYHYQVVLKLEQINSLTSQVTNLTNQVNSISGQVSTANGTITTLNQTITELQNKLTGSQNVQRFSVVFMNGNTVFAQQVVISGGNPTAQPFPPSGGSSHRWVLSHAEVGNPIDITTRVITGHTVFFFASNLAGAL